MTLYALLKALHVLSIVVWVGGMAFSQFFLRPSLEVLDGPQRLRLMHAVLGRFFRAVLVAALVALATGLWMVGRVARQAVGAGGTFSWPLDWVVMTAVGVFMVALFGHIRFVLWRRFDRAVRGGEPAQAADHLAGIRRWVGVNLGLGLLLIAGVLLY